MKVYLSGIAGTGMSALAGLFKKSGHHVSGSDSNIYPPVDRILEEMDIKTFLSYNPQNIPPDVDLCIIGNVISRGNPELEHILNHGIPFESMAGALYKYFLADRCPIVVAGTHGKTTISSFIAHLLQVAGLNPGFFIGGKPLNFDSNHAVGSGRFFVVEGDEYETSFFDRSSKFLKYHPYYLILSALEYDHIDFFPTEDLYLKSFQNLVNQVPGQGRIIVNADFKMASQAVSNAFTPVTSYGSAGSDYVIKLIRSDGNEHTFTLESKGKPLTFSTPLVGEFDIWNLTAGIILARELAVPLPAIREAISTFQGVERRLRLLNQLQNTLIFEDFAHHPTAIGGVLSSLRNRYPDHSLLCFFEPRSWSLRRRVFQQRLVDSFSYADKLVMMEVFQKGKIAPDQRLNVERLKGELERRGLTVSLCSDYEQAINHLKNIRLDHKNVIAILSNGSFGGLPQVAKTLRAPA
jgi:UDP-N-acetylmuramate: L-alanyl-gamma-D-glutamyl-meso-diaminopimelate ligase